jgi:hypothetical protein
MLSLNTNVNVPKVRKTQKNFGKTFFFVEEGREEKDQEKAPEPDPFQNVMDPEHWSMQICFITHLCVFIFKVLLVLID